MISDESYYYAQAKYKCERDHLFFSRYFFKHRHGGTKFLINWHHKLICDTVEKVIRGDIKNLVINVSPGSSKTELVVINLIARGLAKNPYARFLHLSYSDDLALLNSGATREIVMSDEYQRLWPLKIADDQKAKKRWNVLVNGMPAGGVYATSLGGQITGFRAGHMAPGFQGAIIIDDPLKPDDAFSRSKLEAANRKLITTVKSRRATPDTPIVLIMQRIAEEDPTGFIMSGNLQGEWTYVKIPALIDDAYMATIPEQFRPDPASLERGEDGRFSYWQFKEPLKDLMAMEQGGSATQSGAKISKHVFSSQYQQNPVSLGGNIIKGEYFSFYTLLPKIKYRKIFADTAQKTKERNDYSVFECWGLGEDNRMYLLDMIRGKWEAPELQKRAQAFWAKHKAVNDETHGQLRKMAVEDKSSGTGLIQTIRLLNQIPIDPIERVKDKLTRVMDALPYLEMKMVCLPEGAPFTSDFVAECESFSADDSHAFDDQVDPMLDAINDMLSSTNKLKQWEQLANKEKES